MQAAAAGSPVVVHIDTDERGVVSDAQASKRHAQESIDAGGAVKIPVKVDRSALDQAATTPRNLSTVAGTVAAAASPGARARQQLDASPGYDVARWLTEGSN